MEIFLENLQGNLQEMGGTQPMVAVRRSDLEQLIKAHEKRQGMDAQELEAVIRALRYFESDFGMTDKERALFNRLQNDLEEVE